MISSIIPTHNHIIPIAVFSAQNHNDDTKIHIIPKIKIPVLLIIIPPTNPGLLVCTGKNYTMYNYVVKPGEVFDYYGINTADLPEDTEA